MIVIFYSFSKFIIFSHAVILAAIFSFSLVNLLIDNYSVNQLTTPIPTN